MEKQQSAQKEEDRQISDSGTVLEKEKRNRQTVFSNTGKHSVGLNIEEPSVTLINQMKGEIRKLYGEKVNMMNTSYILKPHEFKCLAAALHKGLSPEEKAPESVDELIYAADCIVNRMNQLRVPDQKDGAQEQKESGREHEEEDLSIRCSTEMLRRLISSELPHHPLPQNRTFQEVAASLAEAKDTLERVLASVGRPSVEALAVEKERTKRLHVSVANLFGVSPGGDLLENLMQAKAQEAEKLQESSFLIEKRLECQRKHYEERLSSANLALAEAQTENQRLKRMFQEKANTAEEVLQRSRTLEESISQMKQELQEEERKQAAERSEYAELKYALVEQNRKMSKVVQELVSRIKAEKKEKEDLASLLG